MYTGPAVRPQFSSAMHTNPDEILMTLQIIAALLPYQVQEAWADHIFPDFVYNLSSRESYQRLAAPASSGQLSWETNRMRSTSAAMRKTNVSTNARAQLGSNTPSTTLWRGGSASAHLDKRDIKHKVPYGIWFKPIGWFVLLLRVIGHHKGPDRQIRIATWPDNSRTISMPINKSMITKFSSVGFFSEAIELAQS